MKITKKAKEANLMYDYSRHSAIWEAYQKPSYAKISAYWEIYDEMVLSGGHDLRITGANSSFFSCAYILGDKLIYHTHANRYEYPRVSEA